MQLSLIDINLEDRYNNILKDLSIRIRLNFNYIKSTDSGIELQIRS